MKEKKCIRTNDYTAEEIDIFNAQILELENKKVVLKSEKSNYTNSINSQIKAVEEKIEKWRNQMNNGVYYECEKYLNKDDMTVEWKCDGVIIKVEKMTSDDLADLERRAQTPLFPDDDEQISTTSFLPPELSAPEENIIDVEAEDLQPGEDPFSDYPASKPPSTPDEGEYENEEPENE